MIEKNPQQWLPTVGNRGNTPVVATVPHASCHDASCYSPHGSSQYLPIVSNLSATSYETDTYQAGCICLRSLNPSMPCKRMTFHAFENICMKLHHLSIQRALVA